MRVPVLLMVGSLAFCHGVFAAQEIVSSDLIQVEVASIKVPERPRYTYDASTLQYEVHGPQGKIAYIYCQGHQSRDIARFDLEEPGKPPRTYYFDDYFKCQTATEALKRLGEAKAVLTLDRKFSKITRIFFNPADSDETTGVQAGDYAPN